MRLCANIMIVMAWAALLPRATYAQASITGVVTDTTGAVLPGVTVEASSDVLIEKIRSAVSDRTGQYRIVDLRPGTYTVTFALTGFTTVRRDGVELTGSFTASINAAMGPGGVAETLIVTSETPIVDLRSATRQTTMGGDVVKAIPSARSYAGIVYLIPAIVTQTGTAADVQVVPGLVVFGAAGGRNNEGRLQVDGVNVGAAFNGAGTSGYLVDMTNSQEVALTTSGGLGEAEVGGPTMNVVPKTGGNVFSGTVYAAGLNDAMVGSNYSQELEDAGLSVPSDILKLWDVSAGIGGPIKKDRVWFFGHYRDEGSHHTIPNMYANANFNGITAPVANAAASWAYVPDTTKQARFASSWTVTSLRLTVQATQRNKFNLFWDEQRPCGGATWTPQGEGCRHPTDTEVYSFLAGGVTGTTATSPEATGYSHRFTRVQQATWTSPLTRRLLLEAAFGTQLGRWGNNRRPDSVTPDLVRVVERCTQGCTANGNIPGLNYRSEAPSDHWQGAHTWRASASFVTGAHNMKFGYQGAYHVDERKNFPNSTSTNYFFQNGVPSQISEMLIPFQERRRVRYHALYGQEQWTIGRATMQAAVRYDHAWSYFPDQQVGPVRFLPAPVVFARNDPAFAGPSTALCGTVPAGFTAQCINHITGYDDITPRLGLAYDLFGTGKTSVKVSLGKYLEAASNDNGNWTAGNPVSRMATGGVGGTGPAAVIRTWTDVNKNYVPDCTLENPLAQDNRAAGGDFCGQISNLNFGKPVFTNSFDADLMGGWGVRPSDWGFGVSVQQEVLPRTSIEIGYHRRWLQNYTAIANILTRSSDYTPFNIVAPADSRLPGEGGFVVSDLYDPVQAVASVFNNFSTRASQFGAQYQRYNGVLFNISSRVRNGLTLQGGINLGKTVSDSCEIRAKIPELAVNPLFTSSAVPPVGLTSPYCHFDSGIVWRATSLAAYVIPRIDVQVSGTFRSDQGGWLRADYGVTSAIANQGPQPLGRNLSNNVPFVTVNLITPGTLYGDRVNELDFKIAKILKLGRTRTNVGLEMYNILNSDAVLTHNQTFNPSVRSGPGSWLQPTQVLTPRFVKFSAQIDF